MPGAHCIRSFVREDGILECTRVFTRVHRISPAFPHAMVLTGCLELLCPQKSARMCDGRLPTNRPSLEVTFGCHRSTPRRNPRARHPVYASDDTPDLVLACFRTQPGEVERLLPVGAKGCVSGTAQMFGGTPQIVRSDRIVDEAGFVNLSGIDAVHPLIEGLTARPALPGPPP